MATPKLHRYIAGTYACHSGNFVVTRTGVREYIVSDNTNGQLISTFSTLEPACSWASRLYDNQERMREEECAAAEYAATRAFDFE